jgi:superfamily II DNA/RNA helicase
MKLTPYQAKYFAYELTKRSSSDSVEKFASTLVDIQAQVDLNPHQVEAALFAFRSPLSKGALLADEVGLGKTIEAGLVISQKWAERKKHILIITPANLRKQWSQELADKFFLPSTILEARSFNEHIKGGKHNPFDRAVIVICSYQFARTKASLIKGISWDLVVIDEAHRLRNVYKPGNKIARAIKESLEHAPKKILLTATPLQNSLLELYGLISIIDEFTFGDLKSFKNQYGRIANNSEAGAFSELKERLKPVCNRTLRRQVLEYIKYTNRIALVEEFYPTEEEQKLYDLVSSYLQEDQLYALPSSQRKLMTLILRRLLASSTYAISGTLEALVKKLENLVAEKSSEIIESVVSENFETYEEMKDEWDEEEPIAEDEKLSEADIENIKLEIKNLKEFEALAKSIRKNSKGEKLFTALQKGFSEMQRLGAPHKAIIFTESTRTQDYLRSILEERGYEDKVVLFNGSNSDAKSRQIYSQWAERYKGTDKVSGSRTADMRAALVDYFRNEATIMIATEAAAEGINLQFCSLLINYDMPWNPQRIEQRIGRCHRYGQQFDVVVVNFLNKANAADVRVYELLNDKFKLFNGVFGASDEVLGSIENGVDFEKRIAKIYQECRSATQISIAFNELQSELETQISDAMKQTRQKLLENFDEAVHEKLRINFQESKDYLSKYENWLWCLTKFYLKDDGEFATDEHSFTLRSNPFPEAKIHPGPYKIGKNLDDVNVYRIGHPLAQAIIHECKTALLPCKELIFNLADRQIAALSPYVNKSGYLTVQNYSVAALEEEDYLLLSGVTDDAQVLDDEACIRLFSLIAEEGEQMPLLNGAEDLILKTIVQKQAEILESVGLRNSSFFEQELEKLDSWGEDRRSSLKIELKELDEQIKAIKKESRLAANLPDKLKLEKERRNLENKRDTAWKEYDNAAKEIERSKDALIDTIEKKLRQKVKEENLFTIRWTIK